MSKTRDSRLGNPRRACIGLILLATACSTSTQNPGGSFPSDRWDGSPESERKATYRPVVGTKGMVVADDADAAAWGVEILRRGGNAVDAAVATAFFMAVSRPHFASLGGGGFILYCPKPVEGRAERCETIDYREQAPERATRDMFVRDGKARTDLSQDGALASGVPGVTAGLLLALEKYGSRPRHEVLSRPIEIAKRGTPMTGHMESVALERWDAMNSEARRIWGCGGSKPCEPGVVVKQPELARVLEEIRAKGAAGFYRGWVAQKIAQGIRAENGILRESDLGSYEPRVRKTVSARYLGMEVISMPPPSAGGTTLLQMLRYAELADDAGMFEAGFWSAPAIHALTHGMSLAFADRAKHFADPASMKVSVESLLARDYLDDRWDATFKKGSAAIPADAGVPVAGGSQTTHFSVIDRQGNAVAVTTTVNDNFGSGFVPPGTGVVMNNEMDDFAIQPGVPNSFGLVQGEGNAIVPGRRPLSSMSPTIVRDEAGQTRIVIGAQGGPKITSSVFLALIKRLRFRMSIQEAVITPRFHHQWKPVELMLEPGFGAETREELAGMGYSLKDIAISGKMTALERYPNGRVWGVSDPRAEGAAVAE